MNYCDLTDEDIYKLAGEKWEALPIETRTLAKSIELCEDLFILREMDRYAKNMESTAHFTTQQGMPETQDTKD